MKILVITFAKDVNPGCYMQAFGVYRSMKSIWPDADIRYMRFENFKTGSHHTLTESKKEIFLRKANSLVRKIKYARNRSGWFVEDERCISLFNPTDEDIAHLKSYDLIVIGSDTILEKAYDDNGQIGLNWMPLDIPKIFFAASASPANFTPDNRLREVAEKSLFKGLRDDLTMRLFKDRMGIDASMLTKQPDATFCLDAPKYDLPGYYTKQLSADKNYVLCNFMPWFPYKNEIKDILHRHGYTIVSTEYQNFADIVLATMSAEEWAGIFKHMSLVFTERFHDSVFALRNCVPVINVDWDKSRFDESGDSKTLGILKDYSMEEFHITLKSPSDTKKIEYVLTNVLPTFNPVSVNEYNKKYIGATNDILTEIKKSFEKANL